MARDVRAIFFEYVIMMLEFLKNLSALMAVIVSMVKSAEKKKQVAMEADRQERINNAKDDPVKSFDAMFNAGRDDQASSSKSKED